MTAKLSLPWWLPVQAAILTGIIASGLTRSYRLGMAFGIAGFIVTFLSHDFKGRRR